MNDLIIKIDDVKKQYRLGTIGGGTLQGDLQTWWAKKRGKEDPNSKIGAKVYKKNEKFMALNGITFDVKKGERVGIIGHNGAGKSTLLKILSRVTAPTEGKIYLNGRITSMLEVGTGFHAELTGRENVYLNGAILGMTKEEVTAKMDKIIEFSEVGQFIDTPVKRYSSGMYVKLAFSVAAHLDSEIMIMDEVLAVGDMKFQEKCIDKMSEVSNDEGRTILYVSHNMATIRRLCNRVIVLDHGEVIFNGDVEEGIDVYLSNKINDLSVDNDLSDIIRPRYISKMKNQMCRFTRVYFQNKEVPIYQINESIPFQITVKALERTENPCFRFEVMSKNGTNIGAMFHKFEDVLEKGETKTYDFEFKDLHLIPGKYMVTIVLYNTNKLNISNDIDNVDPGMVFKITDTNGQLGIRWNKVWGNIKYDDPAI